MPKKNCSKEFDKKLPYFAFFLIILATSYIRFISKVTSTFGFVFAEAILCTIVWLRYKRMKCDRWKIVFILLYIIVTVISFYTLGIEHFDKIRVYKNIINTFLKVYVNMILIDVYFDKKIDDVFKKIIGFMVVLEGIYYIYFKLVGRELNEVLFNVPINLNAAPRFHGTLAEPVIMGFWLGIMAFAAMILLKKRFRVIAFGIILFILFFDCRAKFALIAFPLAIISALLIVFFKQTDKLYAKASIIALTILILIVPLAYFWSNMFYSFTARFFGNNASFATRFFFPVAALKEFVIYPIGVGFGWNYEYFYRQYTDVTRIIAAAGMDIRELGAYVNNLGNEAGFTSKETMSYLLCSYGIIGIMWYVYTLKVFVTKRHRNTFWVMALISFIFFESLITICIFDIDVFPITILGIMIINSVEIKMEKREEIIATDRLGGV